MGAATLGSVFENYRLNATCHDCGQSRELDVGQLMEKYGEDFEIPHLSKMAKGTVCGSLTGCAVQLGNLETVRIG